MRSFQVAERHGMMHQRAAAAAAAAAARASAVHRRHISRSGGRHAWFLLLPYNSARAPASDVTSAADTETRRRENLRRRNNAQKQLTDSH